MSEWKSEGVSDWERERESEREREWERFEMFPAVIQWGFMGSIYRESIFIPSAIHLVVLVDAHHLLHQPNWS